MDPLDAVPKLVEVSESKPRQPVRVIILTGLLGAGKTTLLKTVLSGDHGKRIAVIMNELGDSEGIDRVISEQTSSGQKISYDEWVELRNGCICCNVKDAGTAALEKLVEKYGSVIDYVLIETTGMADPSNMISMFWLDAELESSVALSGVVTVVDAYNLHRLLLLPLKDRVDAPGYREAERQIALADRVLLNKSDLITKESHLKEVKDWAQSINALAKFETTRFSKVGLDFVLETRAYDLEGYRDLVAGLEGPPHSLINKVTATTVNLPASGISQKAVESWLHCVLWDPQEFEILRIKGVFYSTDDGCWYAIQAVNQLYEFTKLSKVESLSFCKLIVIGVSLLEHWDVVGKLEAKG